MRTSLEMKYLTWIRLTEQVENYVPSHLRSSHSVSARTQLVQSSLQSCPAHWFWITFWCSIFYATILLRNVHVQPCRRQSSNTSHSTVHLWTSSACLLPLDSPRCTSPISSLRLSTSHYLHPFVWHDTLPYFLGMPVNVLIHNTQCCSPCGWYRSAEIW